MVKVVALVRRSNGLARDEFLRHWQRDHPPLVWALPRLRRYVQSPAVEGYRDWPFDGMAELWFDSVRDVAAAFDSPAAKPMLEHEKLFIGELNWFLATDMNQSAPGPVTPE